MVTPLKKDFSSTHSTCFTTCESAVLQRRRIKTLQYTNGTFTDKSVQLRQVKPPLCSWTLDVKPLRGAFQLFPGWCDTEKPFLTSELPTTLTKQTVLYDYGSGSKAFFGLWPRYDVTTFWRPQRHFSSWLLRSHMIKAVNQAQLFLYAAYYLNLNYSCLRLIAVFQSYFKKFIFISVFLNQFVDI